jgi:hypothetical protein
LRRSEWKSKGEKEFFEDSFDRVRGGRTEGGLNELVRAHSGVGGTSLLLRLERPKCQVAWYFSAVITSEHDSEH